jgi:hypothetical protein
MARSRDVGMVVLLTAACVWALAAPGVAEDAETARLLLQSGKDALAKKRYDEAVKFFEKAHGEDAGLIEAVYFAATAIEARKDVPAAVERYRAYLAAHRAKKQEGKATPEEDALAATATARLGVLAAATEDLRKAQDAYVDRLFAFVGENLVKDPGIAEKALRMLLAVRPQHAEARAALSKLPGRAATGEAVGEEAAAAGVHKWVDLLEKKTLGKDKGAEYGAKSVTFDHEDSKQHFADAVRPTGPSFVLEVELRMLEERGVDPTAGLLFAKEPAGPLLCLLLAEGQMVLFRGTREGVENLALTEASVDRTQWHRLTLLVDGNEVEGRVDGKSIVKTTIAGRTSLLGSVGLWVQGIKVEVRAFRLGMRD